jgi:hypothetical protein
MKADNEAVTNARKNSCEAFYVFPTPNPPGIVAAELETRACGPDQFLQIDHIILQDGSVWRWANGESDLGGALNGVFLCAGGFIGTLLGTIIGLVIAALRPRSK